MVQETNQSQTDQEPDVRVVVSGSDLSSTIGERIPRYLQIAAALREKIVSGDLPPGSLLPSERDLAQEWSVARATATRALQVLRLQGWTSIRPGVGAFVQGNRSGIDLFTMGGQVDAHIVVRQFSSEEIALEFECASTEVLSRYALVRINQQVQSGVTTWLRTTDAVREPALGSTVHCDELALLAKATGVTINRVRNVVRARMASAAELRIFQLVGSGSESAPVLVHRRWHYAGSHLVAMQESVRAPQLAGVEWELHLT